MAMSKRADQPRNSRHISPPVGCCTAVDTGHAALFSHRMVKRCTFRSAPTRMFRIMLRKKIARAFSSLTLTVAGKKFTPGEFETPWASRFAQERLNFG